MVKKIRSDLDGQDNGRGDGLPRRDLLKALGALPLASMPVAGYAAPQTRPAVQQPTAQPASHSPFDGDELAMLSQLSDWIIPTDERSGSASEAGVVSFLSDWLGMKGGTPQATIKGGLRWLNQACREKFGQSFIHCDHTQQQVMIDRIAWPGDSRPEDLPGEIFFSQLRDLVVGAFFSTEMGVKDLPYIGNQPMHHWSGCPEAVLRKLGV